MFSITPRHEFLIGIDSDGCVFDSMELKHKECFIPQFINHYELQGVSKYAREAAEFVNLYSKSRGVNRFPGLVEQLDLVAPPAGSAGPRRARGEAGRAHQMDGIGIEARQSRAREGGCGDGGSRSEASTRLVASR